MNYSALLVRMGLFASGLPARVEGMEDCVAAVLHCLLSGDRFRLTPSGLDGCQIERLSSKTAASASAQPWCGTRFETSESVPARHESSLERQSDSLERQSQLDTVELSQRVRGVGEEKPSLTLRDGEVEDPAQTLRVGSAEDGCADDGRNLEYGWKQLWQELSRSAGKIAIATSGTASLKPGRLAESTAEGDSSEASRTWIEHDFQSLSLSVRNAQHHVADRWGLAFHPTSFAGLQVIFQALTHLNPVVSLLQEAEGGPEIGNRIRESALTHLSATPTFFRTLVGRMDSPCPGVCSITLGGEALDSHLCQWLQQFFPNARVRNIYASTELGSVLQSSNDTFTVPTSDQERIKIQQGELWIRPHAANVSDLELNEEGYFQTGDQVEIVSNDPLRFRFVGRSSTVINVGGRKVDPVMVEWHLEEMSEIESAVVYGKSNSVSGNLVAAQIVLRQGKELPVSQIRKRLGQTLQSFEIPRMVQFVKAIPKTATGKKKRILE